MNLIQFILSFLSVCYYVVGLRTKPSSQFVVRNFGVIKGQRWGGDVCEKPTTLLPPATSFKHLGENIGGNDGDYIDDYGQRQKNNYNLNVGKAMEVLRRELPMVFAVTNLDFSIFANSITVTDGTNTMTVQKSLYGAAVKSLRMASVLSSMYPSMNVKKIEYIEEQRTIQCLVDVVLPDSVRIDGSSVWQGMFYFGLDGEGLIDSHIFDRKISNLRPQMPVNTATYPWLKSTTSWSPSLLGGGAQRGGLVSACTTKGVSDDEVSVDAI